MYLSLSVPRYLNPSCKSQAAPPQFKHLYLHFHIHLYIHIYIHTYVYINIYICIYLSPYISLYHIHMSVYQKGFITKRYVNKMDLQIEKTSSSTIRLAQAKLNIINNIFSTIDFSHQFLSSLRKQVIYQLRNQWNARSEGLLCSVSVQLAFLSHHRNCSDPQRVFCAVSVTCKSSLG